MAQRRKSIGDGACAREERCGVCTSAEGEGKGETGLDHEFIKRGREGEAATRVEVAIDGHGAGGFDLESREGEVTEGVNDGRSGIEA
jgi:hypothetical protein